MIEVRRESLGAHSEKYTLTRSGRAIRYADVLELWQQDDLFRHTFLSLLAASPFTAYRWETPPINHDTVTRDFEFVLHDAPWLAGAPDPGTYRQHFLADDDDNGVVIFDNLGGDALLVAPTPRGPLPAYGHLAAFVRQAPRDQQHALWCVVGRTVQESVSATPLWLSTAGGGVAWLHLRLDKRPKYYSHAPYTRAP